MLTLNDFITRMVSKYANATEYDIDDLKSWVINSGLNDQQIDDLYHYVSAQYEYNTFPKLGKIIKIWGNTGTTIKEKFKYNDFQKAAIECGKDLSLKDICKKINDIRSLETVKSSDVDFIDVWEDLSTIYGILMDRNQPVERLVAYCNKLKQVILSGERVSVDKAIKSFCGIVPQPIGDSLAGQFVKQVPEAEA